MKGKMKIKEFTKDYLSRLKLVLNNFDANSIENIVRTFEEVEVKKSTIYVQRLC